MIYYSKEARNCALENLQNLRSIFSSIPGNVVPLKTVRDAIHYFSVLSNAIESEQYSCDRERQAVRRNK